MRSNAKKKDNTSFSSDEDVLIRLKELEAEVETREQTAHKLRDHLLALSECCKVCEWHLSGLLLSISAQHLGDMLEQNEITQSLDDIYSFFGGRDAK